MTVIVGVDGSASSRLALGFAIEEGRLRDQPVCAVYAWSAPTEPAPGGQIFGAQIYETSAANLSELESLARERLGHLVAEVAGGEDVEQRVVFGPPAEVLVDIAGEDDLLVVGSRGHGAFTATLLGSVSQACTHHAACPVIVVRGKRSSVGWQVDDVIAREYERNAETWRALCRLGVDEGSELALEFVYESGGAESDAELAAHLRQTTDYTVDLDDSGVSGETRPMALGRELLDNWVREMICAGHDHGGCAFGGWTATVEQDPASEPLGATD